MTLFFSWGVSPGALGNTTVRLGKVSLTMKAEKGDPAISDLPIDDPGGTIVPDALLPVSVSETACSVPYLFRGYAADRDAARGDGDSLITLAARRWTGHVADVNAVFAFDVLHGSGANRPSESCNARLAWLLSTNFGTLIADYGAVYTAPAIVSAADYRGQFPGNVMNDLAERSGYNYFAYNDAATGGKALAFFPDLTFTGLDSTLRLTNVLADHDGTTTFAAKATLNRDPTEVYNGILLEWAGGQLYKSSGSTGVRQATVSKTNITTLAHAQAYADRWLTDHASEQDTITAQVEVPASKVNLIAAGSRIQVKFTHLDGYTSYTWIRCTSLTRAQEKETDQLYTLTMTLKNPRATHGSGGAGPPSPVPVPIPFPGGACAEIVQQTNFYAAATTISLPSAPATGNVVCIAVLWANTGVHSLSSVTPAFSGNYEFDTGLGYGLGLRYRVVTGGETGSYDITGVASGRAFALVELSGIGALTAHVTTTGSEVGGGATQVLTANAGAADSFILTLFMSEGITIGPNTDYLEAIAPTTAITNWDVGISLNPIGMLTYQSDGLIPSARVHLDGYPYDAANWGAITLSFASDCGDFTPAYGQEIPWACVNGDGSTLTFTTLYPYIVGTLEVTVDGLPIVNGLTATNGTTFTLDFAPLGAIGDSAAERVCYRYQAGTT